MCITSGRINYTKLKREVIFGVVGRLNDYRTSLFLKGKRLFHTKNTRLFDEGSQENATTVTLRLSQSARYYTIYRTFKRWSSDDFTTISEAVTTIPAGTLRLLLTSIGCRATARKEIRR